MIIFFRRFWFNSMHILHKKKKMIERFTLCVLVLKSGQLIANQI